MMQLRLLTALATTAFSLGVAVPAGASDIPLRNWPVPGVSAHAGTRTALADVGSPGVFVPVTPCRVADTRGAAGPYGGPILSTGVIRSFDIDSGPCTGIAVGSSAYSLNFTVTGSLGGNGNFLSVWPTGGAQPLVSTLNYNVGDTLANAAIVPAGTGGAINVIVSGSVHLIIDINGYYVDKDSTLNPSEYVGFYGTWGAGLLFAQNYTTSTDASASAVRGYIQTAPNGSAVLGDQAAATGANFGVRGNNSSTTSNSAGVLGVAGSRADIGPITYRRAGVRGESASDLGVLGTTNSGGIGIVGSYITGGVIQSYGSLGLATAGVYYSGGLAGSGSKSFVEPHPTDATKMIQYYCLEGGESGTYFRGSSRTVGGQAVLDVPESFRLVSDAEGLTVQVTPNALTQIAVTSKGLDRIVVESSKDVSFDYIVHGVRRAYKDLQSIVPNTFLRPESAQATLPASLSKEEQQRLIANGTYNPDGTVNLETAERVGWAQMWRDQEKARADSTTTPPKQ